VGVNTKKENERCQKTVKEQKFHRIVDVITVFDSEIQIQLAQFPSDKQS
jgi:hypothetical protein